MSLSSRCELCEAAPLTPRYYDDAECWIADCLICRVPMVVWRVHDATPPPEVHRRLVERLTTVAEKEFLGRGWYFDDHMRNIPDHYHGHARPVESVGDTRAKR
ncbi:MAG: hypothetical protein PXZ08_03660 [Actinomycetota bacterium]|nr:hypothetical protein [Actinomycetota bacterium]